MLGIVFAVLTISACSTNDKDTEMTMAGGWTEAQPDEMTNEAVAFVISRMNTTGKLKRIVKVKKQVVSGMNYDITFELDNNTAWNAVVYRNLSGEYSITKVSSMP
jgi:hypothetical protein